MKYRVFGVQRTSGEAAELTIDARSARDAEAQANGQGIVVEGSAPLSPQAKPSGASSPSPPRQPQPSRTPRPARRDLLVKPSAGWIVVVALGVGLGIPIGSIATVFATAAFAAGVLGAAASEVSSATSSRSSAPTVTWYHVPVGGDLAPGTELLSVGFRPWGSDQVVWEATYSAGSVDDDRVEVRAVFYDQAGDVVHITGSETERIDGDGGEVMGFCTFSQSVLDRLATIDLEVAE